MNHKWRNSADRRDGTASAIQRPPAQRMRAMPHSGRHGRACIRGHVVPSAMARRLITGRGWSPGHKRRRRRRAATYQNMARRTQPRAPVPDPCGAQCSGRPREIYGRPVGCCHLATQPAPARRACSVRAHTHTHRPAGMAPWAGATVPQRRRAHCGVRQGSPEVLGMERLSP